MSDEIIWVKLNLFTFNQTVYMQDKLGTKNTTYVQTDDLPRYVCALAKERKVNQVKVVGANEFAEAVKDEIKDHQKTNYANDFLIVEVVKENEEL